MDALCGTGLNIDECMVDISDFKRFIHTPKNGMQLKLDEDWYQD